MLFSVILSYRTITCSSVTLLPTTCSQEPPRGACEEALQQQRSSAELVELAGGGGGGGGVSAVPVAESYDEKITFAKVWRGMGYRTFGS